MAVVTLASEIARSEKRRQIYSFAIVLIVFAVIFAGYGQANSMNSGGFLDGLSKFFEYPGEIAIEAWQSETGLLSLMVKFLPALIETLNIAAVATILGGVGATVLAFLATSNLDVWPPLVPVVRRCMDLMRAFPELIIALFLIFVLGTSPVPAMIAVAFHTAGALGKQFSEVNDNIDRKPIEGLHACGANWLQRMRFAVLPQVLPNYLSYFMLRFEINVRASAILGFVGAGGIGSELRKAISWGKGEDITALFIVLFITIVIIDQVSSYLRQRVIGQTLSTTA